MANVDLCSNLIQQVILGKLFLPPKFIAFLLYPPRSHFFRDLYVEFLWLENLSAFFGSYVIFLIGCYGFLADTTNQDSRTIRIAVMDGCIFSTNILGNYVNGPIYKKFDYFGSFAGGAVCFAVGFCLVGLFFKEPIRREVDTTEREEKKGESNLSLTQFTL